MERLSSSWLLWLVVLLALLWASMNMSEAAEASWYQPTPDTRWQIQLYTSAAYPLDTHYRATLYDVDLFDTDVSVIAQLHADGHRVICYFSAGTWEDWRPDADAFPAFVIGHRLADWPGEKWLDIRRPEVADLMKKRMNLARSKGCDGVDADNVDSAFNTNIGFPLTPADQLAYNASLARAAHARGLAIGLKNDLNQVGELVSLFDFAVNEQCYQYKECDLLQPFVDAGKPVFELEYRQLYVDDLVERRALCSDARDHGRRALIAPRQLNGAFRISCR